MSVSLLDAIVRQKRLEIASFYRRFSLAELRRQILPSAKNCYAQIARYRSEKRPFVITEFKRKSPSEGWINEHADLRAQVQNYADAGAGAVSVLTDTHFFGGAYDDLRTASEVLRHTDVLLLQKDFILDPIQILLARQSGADIILLIAAILSPPEIAALRAEAEALGMGVLVEVHDATELDRIQHLDFPLLGINNRDLKTFRTALNRVNTLRRKAGGRFVIAESGIKDYRDFRVVQHADGFLIGTALMRHAAIPTLGPPGETAPLLFKACGIRQPEHLQLPADYLGINFSPLTKRKPSAQLLQSLSETRFHPSIGGALIALFYKNTESEIRQILTQYPFNMVQLYAGDVSPAFVRGLKQKVALACRIGETADLDVLEDYAADVDFFILDGTVPGSGRPVGAAIPHDFPYPFLLAGGMHAGNLELARQYDNCIGVDIASGIETAGEIDVEKVQSVATHLKATRISITV